MIDARGLEVEKSVGDAGVYEKQALVLVNRGAAIGSEVMTLARAIRRKASMGGLASVSSTSRWSSDAGGAALPGSARPAQPAALRRQRDDLRLHLAIALVEVGRDIRFCLNRPSSNPSCCGSAPCGPLPAFESRPAFA